MSSFACIDSTQVQVVVSMSSDQLVLRVSKLSRKNPASVDMVSYQTDVRNLLVSILDASGLQAWRGSVQKIGGAGLGL